MERSANRIVTRGGGGRSPVDRVRTVLATLAGGRGPVALSFRTACEVGDKLAARLGIPEAPRGALRFGFERWNGRGFPDGVKGEAIPLPMRVIHVACDAEVLDRVQGREHALGTLRRRSGRAYDPESRSGLSRVGRRSPDGCRAHRPLGRVAAGERLAGG